MQFRTELTPPISPWKLTHNLPIFGMGSCFVNSIGKELEHAKFQTLINPFGTLFHPLAIENALMRIHSLTPYTKDEIFKYKELFFSWDHHSSFSQISLKATLEKINVELEIANEFMRNAGCFILTFGTSWVYKIKELDLFVANCHKIPAANFSKHLLTDQQIKLAMVNCINLLFDINPHAKIITTVSPVRHVKDGLVENTISKAKLLTNLFDIIGKYENLDYFPAYEFMIDDLRDYRFYKEDLIHPSEMAVHYIWDKFSKSYFDASTMDKIKLVQKINSALSHRPMNTQTTSYKEFLYKTNKSIDAIESQFPKNSFISERLALRKMMNDVN